jgi:molybdopterin synthase sulfur carrier subunit
MADVAFTPNLQRHVECPRRDVPGGTVREVLEGVFTDNPRLRGYIVDERGALRRHMIVFVDGRQISDRERLSDRVGPRSEIYIMQALSGGS